jgi:hypothetical protein
MYISIGTYRYICTHTRECSRAHTHTHTYTHRGSWRR